MKGFTNQEKEELIRMAKESKLKGSSLSSVFSPFAKKYKRADGSVRNYYYYLIKTEGYRNNGLTVGRVKPFDEKETVEIVESVLTGASSGKSVRRVIDEMAQGDAKRALRIQNKYRNVVTNDKVFVQSVMASLAERGLSYKNPYAEKKEKKNFLYKRLQREINALFEKIAVKEKKINEQLKKKIFELEKNDLPEKSRVKDFFVLSSPQKEEKGE